MPKSEALHASESAMVVTEQLPITKALRAAKLSESDLIAKAGNAAAQACRGLTVDAATAERLANIIGFGLTEMMILYPARYTAFIPTPFKVQRPLAKALRCKNMKQADLAGKIGVNPSFIAQLINGHSGASPEKAQLIVEAVGCGLNELMIFYPERYPDFEPTPNNVADAA